MGHPIYDATVRKNLEALARAVAKGFRPDDPSAVDDWGRSPLQRAIEDCDRQGCAMVEALLRAGANPNGTPWHEATPMETAALWCELEAMEMLADYGAQVGAPDPSSAAFAIAQREQHEDAVILLRTLWENQRSRRTDKAHIRGAQHQRRPKHARGRRALPQKKR